MWDIFFKFVAFSEKINFIKKVMLQFFQILWPSQKTQTLTNVLRPVDSYLGNPLGGVSLSDMIDIDFG